MEFRDAVHRLRRGLLRQFGLFVVELVDGAVLWILEPPRAAQVDHVDTLGQRFRCPLARDLVRCGEKEHVHAFRAQRLPAERLQRIASIPAHVGIELVEPRGDACLAVARKQYWLLRVRMAGEQTRQFKTGVTGCSNNRGLDCCRHQARMSSMRVCSFRALLLSGVMMRMVSSPATVPTTSSQPSAST